MGINFQVTKKNSVEILYNLEKSIRQSNQEMNNLHIPDKDKLYNQLHNISTWNLIKLVYIKLVFSFTYKCQYYCLSDSAKLAQKAYLKTSKQYNSIMSSKQLLNLSVNEVSDLIGKISSHIMFNDSAIFFDKGRPYVIYDKVRYNLWDNVKNVIDTVGSYKTLAQSAIPICKYEGNRLDGKIVECNGSVLTTVGDDQSDELDVPPGDRIGYNGWKKFI